MKADKIKEAIKALGIENKTMYTMGELDAISKKSGCALHDVMHYLRFGK